ncbi:MAG: THUMP domain-containing protein [Bacteroidales bacterium]|nr:THUMP domain-containing protein [Bacteroidales bacterium]
MENITEYKEGMDFTAKTFAGLEEVLAEELKAIGAQDVKIIKRGVQFRGDEALLYKANYLLRTALRILKPIGIFEVKDDKQLYEKVMKIDWSKVFNVTQTFSVDANLFFSELDHSQFVSLRTKDAIVDQFREKTGKRPWVSKENADIFIDVHINQDVCTVSLDSSGESLHQRGYRIGVDKAPINEVLAAGMIQLTGWKGDKDFYDPMCGSGTIAIEAAMVASNIPAGHYREQFAFMSWEDFDEELWGKIKQEADSGMVDPECNIFASDRSEKAIGIAKRNLKKAGLHKDIEIKVGYFDSLHPEKNEGILVFNPPYGKRLEERGDIKDLYQGIGDVLKNNFQGFEAWIISSSFDSMKFIGLRPSRRIHLFNGPLETRFVKFEMYAGSKKGKYMTDDDKGNFGKRDDREPRWKSERRDRDSTGKPEWKKEKRPWDNSEKPAWKKEDKDRKYSGEGNSGKRWEKKDAGDKKWKQDGKRDFDKEKKGFGERKWDQEEKRSFNRESDKKDFPEKSGERKANEQWYGRKPRLGKPDRTAFTRDGKSGTRKRRPRKE